MPDRFAVGLRSAPVNGPTRGSHLTALVLRD